jgi:hypothetical protein
MAFGEVFTSLNAGPKLLAPDSPSKGSPFLILRIKKHQILSGVVFEQKLLKNGTACQF